MRNQRKRRKIIKRLISGVSALALSVGLLGSIPASADDSNIGYKYTLFAYGSEDDAISSSAANFCVNGNIATNGTISAGQNFNVNGEKEEHANEAMPDLSKAINEKYFAENVDVKAENYKNEDVNINVVSPLDVKGKAELNGNIKLAAGVKAMGDIVLSGGVLNNDNTVLFSENGSININSENVSLTGLIYAPKGNIVIESKSLNLNSVVMIANKITLNAPNVNINNSASMAKFVQEAIDKNGNSSSGYENEEDPEPVTDPAIYAYGEYNEETKSVDIEWYSNVTGEFAVLESMNGTDYTVVSKVSDDTKYSIKVASDFIKKFYKVTIIKDGKTIESIPFAVTKETGKYTTELLDTDKDGLADLYEEMLGTDKTLPDTDKDGLTDYEEAYITSTDPTKYDSVTEGVSDANADNDKDGLTNKREIELKTDPNSDDTDGDTLKDGDELSKYNTDPTKKDTDGDDLEDDDEFKFNCDPNKKDTDNNGIIDGKEKHQQTLDVVPDNKEEAVTKVSVSMAASGNIEKTTTVESIMDKDVLCSSVVGLVGEPFSIESESSFDKATITFTVDKTKLGETEFDNLMFLWYDRENDNFVELETSHDAANSTVSIETTHFSEYMIVDSKMWFDNWEQIESDRKRMEQSGTGSSTVHVVEPTATVLYIKCYPSSDPDLIEPVSDSTSTTLYTKTNYRALVSEHLISSMSAIDTMKLAYTEGRYGSTLYGTLKGRLGEDGWEESEAAGDFCGDKSILKQRLDLFLNTATRTNLFRDICWAATDLMKQPEKDRRIVYITDHSGSLDYSIFENGTPQSNAFWKNAYYSVPVYFVCIGKFDRTNLEKIASETGGKVYEVATLNELYSELGEKNHVSNVQDYDGDGFSDMEETYGLIVDSAGKRYKTNPYKKDTDDDGLDDNVEISKDGWCSKEGTDHFGNTVWKRYYSMNSDPTKKDSDEDGLDDILDNAPLNPRVHAFVIYETTANDSDLKVWSPDDDDPNDKTIEHKYPDDLKYADKNMSDLLSTKYITRNDFLFSLPYVNEIYKKGLVDEYAKILIDYHKKGLIDFIEWPSMGEIEEVAKDMVEHFLSGSGEDYRNDILSKRIAKHENTKKYINGVNECFEQLIKENNGNIIPIKYDKNKYILESNKDEKILLKNDVAQTKRENESLMVKKMKNNKDARIPPSYGDFWKGDWFNGLGICIDGLYGNRIEVSSFEFDGKRYKYTLNFVMYDIFGLDSHDLADDNRPLDFGWLEGFRSWYILQHYNEIKGRVKPFITYMEFEKKFEGEI